MRLLLAIASLVILAAACGGGAASTPMPTASVPFVIVRTPTPSPVPTPTPSPQPIPAPTPAPSLDVTGSHSRQGGFLLVRLLNPPPQMAGANVFFNDSSYPMLSSEDHWYSVVGLGTDVPIADYPTEVRSDSGTVASGIVSIGEGGFQYESLDLPPSSTDLLSDQAAVDQERQTLAQVYAGFTPQRLWSGPWILPAPGPISNAFGLQRSINGGPYHPHTGTDLAAPKGAPVVAAASGTVVLAQPLYLYGNAVVIDHGAGVFSSYNHLDGIAVTKGQSVTIGDLIGYVGETGFVSGPHLHWEAIIGGVRTDPTLWTLDAVDP